MPTLCENCEYVEHTSKKGNPRSWLCTKHQRLFDGYVSTKERVTAPFLYCKDVNGGNCPLFKEIEGSQVKLNLEENKCQDQ